MSQPPKSVSQPSKSEPPKSQADSTEDLRSWKKDNLAKINAAIRSDFSHISTLAGLLKLQIEKYKESKRMPEEASDIFPVRTEDGPVLAKMNLG